MPTSVLQGSNKLFTPLVILFSSSIVKFTKPLIDILFILPFMFDKLAFENVSKLKIQTK